MGVRYGSNEVLTAVTFHAGRGDHIVVIGRNGAGKSSLLRCLAGEQEPSNGVIEVGVNVTVGYFAQEHEQIDPARTALANVSDAVLKMEKDRRASAGLVRASLQGGRPDAGDALGRGTGEAGSGHALRGRGQPAAPR